MSQVMTATIYDQIEDVARDLYIRALTDIPKDVRIGLQAAKNAETAAQQKTAEKVMLTVLENVRVADEKNMMVCQDTGLPIYRLRVGNQMQLDMVEVKNRLKVGAERATKEYPLRSNTVHPITRKNTGTNTGQGMPAIKIDFVEGGYCIPGGFRCLPKVPARKI